MTPQSKAAAAPSPSVTRGSGLLESFLAGQRTKRANALIPQRLRDGAILDIGCGSHPFFLINTDFREKVALDQIAIAPEVQERHAIRHCRHDLDLDARLPFEDGRFQAITLLAMVEHVEAEVATRILREAHRVLAPGGVVVVTTPAAWADRILRVMARLGLVSAEEIHEHAFAYTSSTLGLLLRRAGFGAKHLKVGSFEFWMNLWACAEKQAER